MERRKRKRRRRQVTERVGTKLGEGAGSLWSMRRAGRMRRMRWGSFLRAAGGCLRGLQWRERVRKEFQSKDGPAAKAREEFPLSSSSSSPDPSALPPPPPRLEHPPPRLEPPPPRLLILLLLVLSPPTNTSPQNFSFLLLVLSSSGTLPVLFLADDLLSTASLPTSPSPMGPGPKA